MKKILFLTTFVLCSFLSFSQLRVDTQTGNVGIGADPNNAALRVFKTELPSFILESSSSRLQIGVAQRNDDFSMGALAGDVVYRTLGSSHNQIFSIPNNLSDGRSYIGFADGRNGLWARFTNNRTLVMNGDIHLSLHRNIRIGATGDQGNRLRLHHNNVNAWIDFSPNLIFRGGNNLVETMRLTSDGRVGIGRIPASNVSLDVVGNVLVNGVGIISDERLKTEIQPLTESKVSRLYLLQGKSYMKTSRSTGFETMADTLQVFSAEEQEFVERFPPEEQRRIEASEFGFLAQELKEVFPELVEQASDGYYLINYIGLIPVIIEALKEQRQDLEEHRSKFEQQQKLIENLQREVAELRRADSPPVVLPVDPPIFRPLSADADNSVSAFETDETRTAVLHQNVPNPFSQSTQIGFYLPETVRNASLNIFDLTGKQLMQIPLTQRSEGVEIIQGSQFSAGIYLYALIADGREVDVKRMILTQ